MKKIGVLCLVVGALSIILWSQMPTKMERKLKALRALDGEEEKGPKPEYPGEAAAYLAGLRETPNDANPAMLNQVAIDRLVQAAGDRAGTTLPNFTIEDLGPGNYGGRIRGVVIHSGDPDKILVGGVSGGVWKTEDGGLTWRGINDFLPNLSVGCLQADPDNSEVVWMGTGEGFFNIDAARGLGIFKSEDFGETWTQVAATNTSDFYYVNRIARVPGSDIIVAATRTGLFRSTNGGTSFTEVSGVSTSSRGFVDVKVDPSLDSRLYAVHYGGSSATRYMMRSTNSGAGWNQLGAAEGMPTTDVGRMEIGLGSDGVVYASVANNASTTRGVWRSPAGGNAFVKTTSNTDYIPRQGWYDLMIGVDPSDSDRIYLGAVDVYRSTDAGGVINQITFWNPNSGQLDNYVHADIHNIAFHPTDPLTLWIVCDGGIFKSVDGGNNFVSLDNDLRLVQNYGIAVAPDGVGVIGGTQDNGSHLFYGRTHDWLRWAGGDGGYCGWDQQNPDYLYGSTPNGGLFGSSDGGFTTAGITVSGSFAFIQPFFLDPRDGNRMLMCGNSLHYSSNVRSIGGATFTDLGVSVGSLTSAAFSPHSASIAYAGSSSGQVVRTDNLGPGATFTTITSNLPTGSDITWIYVDPNDATSNTVYITRADYGSDRVWKTTNGGGTWTSISSGLADVPAFCVTVDPTDPDRLFLGTELGLWSTSGNSLGSVSWEHFDYGVAWTRVMQIHWGDDDTLYVGTHGRGTFKASRTSFSAVAGPFSETIECDGDAYLDNGETGNINITVTNTGGLSMNNVNVAVSCDVPEVTVGSSVALGSLAAGASGVAPFEVSLDGLAAGHVTATYTVTITHNGGAEMHSFTAELAVDADIQSGTFSEDAEDAATLLTSEALINTDDWGRVSTQASTGSFSWFAADVPNYADKSLISPWLTVTGSTSLSFDLYYDMEGNASQYWDGVVLELRTEGGDWVDIGVQSSVPYDGPLFNNNTNVAKPAWSGSQTTWRAATVNLGSAYNGQNVQFRFRMICDTSDNSVGFWVDNIAMTNVSWLANLNADTNECLSCYGTLPEAVQAILDSAGAGDWPADRTVLNYVTFLNNICP